MKHMKTNISNLTKMTLHFRVIIFLTCITIGSANSQQKWDLNKCIQYTLENNNSLKNAEINKKLQRIHLSQTRINLLPQIGAGLGVKESFGRSVNPATNTYADVNNLENTYGIDASMTIFSGFAKLNRIAFEKYNLKVEDNRLEQQKNLVTYNVIDAYFNLLLHQGVYSLQQENLKLMQEQYTSIKKYIKVGRKAESDIYEFDAKLATDSFLLVQQTGAMDKALLQLKATMNFPIGDSLMVDTVLFSVNPLIDTIQSGFLTETAMKQLPKLKVTENQLFAAMKYVAQVRGAFSPSIEMYAGWNTSYYKTSGVGALPLNEQLKNNAGQYVGLSLKIPIFDRLSRINTLRSAKLEYKKAENNHLENLAYIEMEINAAYIDWQTAKNEYFAAEKQLEKSEVAFLTAEKKFGIGQINVIEFYIQKNELLRAKTELLRTNLQLALKEKYVQFLLSGKWESN